MASCKGPLAVVTAFVSCCVTVVFIELLVKEDPGSGHLFTFCGFVLISLEGVFSVAKCGTKGPVVPIKEWLTLVVMHFSVSVLNNHALDYHISVPMHIIFRSAGLLANMLMGMWVLERRYSLTKYISVLVITAGVILCTVATSKEVMEQNDDLELINVHNEDDVKASLLEWVFGLAMLTVALMLSARMGLQQEAITNKFGKHPREALFYSHFLPLPFFAVLWPEIRSHMLSALESPSLLLLDGLVAMPRLLFFLVVAAVTHCLCIGSVFVLASEYSSLTVSLVLTLRKFVSLLFSVWYFDNPFDAKHVLATVLVFGGSVLFTDVHRNIWQKSKRD